MEVQGGESELVASCCSDQHEWIAITITKRLLFVIGSETLRAVGIELKATLKTRNLSY